MIREIQHDFLDWPSACLVGPGIEQSPEAVDGGVHHRCGVKKEHGEDLHAASHLKERHVVADAEEHAHDAVECERLISARCERRGDYGVRVTECHEAWRAPSTKHAPVEKQICRPRRIALDIQRHAGGG